MSAVGNVPPLKDPTYTILRMAVVEGRHARPVSAYLLPPNDRWPDPSYVRTLAETISDRAREELEQARKYAGPFCHLDIQLYVSGLTRATLLSYDAIRMRMREGDRLTIMEWDNHLNVFAPTLRYRGVGSDGYLVPEAIYGERQETTP